MRCSAGYYYDSVVNFCSPCADICDPRRAIMSHCRLHCPGFMLLLIIFIMSNNW